MSRRDRSSSKPVYSTDKGRLCPDCGAVKADCRCRLTANSNSGDGIARIRRETKGRGGKAVTVITGLAGDPDTIKDLAKTIKQHCGVGGAVKQGDIEIQGDQRAKIKTLLEAKGITVKLAGG